jgi:hypothetical protein
MCTRCIACNAPLSVFDLSSKKPDTDEYEDLCTKCRNYVYSADYYYEHPYEHESLTEDVLNYIR